MIYNVQLRCFWNEESKRYKKAAWIGNLISQYDYFHTKKMLLNSLQPIKKEKLLEIGCGPGLWTELVAKRCSQLAAIDISEKMIERAKKRSQQKNIFFFNCDFMDFETNEKYDKIFSVRVIEYIRNKRKLFGKIRKLLTPNGELVIITKTKNSIWDFYKRFKKLIRFYNRNAFKEVRQFSWFENLSIKQIRSLLNQNNFLLVNILPVIIRLPIFKRGNDEIPLIPKRFEKIILNIFNRLSEKISKIPFNFLFLFTESFLIHAIKGNTAGVI